MCCDNNRLLLFVTNIKDHLGAADPDNRLRASVSGFQKIKRFPSFVIAGVQKCGTGALLKMLSAGDTIYKYSESSITAMPLPAILPIYHKLQQTLLHKIATIK